MASAPERAVRAWPKDLACVAVLVVLAAFHLRAPLGGGFPVSEEYDTLILQYPVHHALDRALAEGELPWWVSEAGNGLPLAAEGEAGAFFPPNLLLFGLLPAWPAYALGLLLALAALGVGTFGFARALGAGRAGALMGGAALMLSGFALGHEHHLSLLRTASLLPWLLWVAEAHVRRTSPDTRFPPPLTLGLGAAVVSLQWLAGNPQIAHMSLATVGLYLPVRGALSAEGLRPRARAAAVGAASFLGMATLGVLVAAVQVVPSWYYAGETGRAGGLSIDQATVLGYPPRDLLMFLSPRAFGTPFEGGFRAVAGERNVFWENVAYVGLLPAALAPFCAWGRERRARGLLVLGLAALGIALALGRHSPVFRAAFAIVPGFDRFRVPQRWLLVTALGLCVAAALALTHLSEVLGRRWSRKGALAVAAGVVVMATFDVGRFGDAYYPTLDRSTVETRSAAARLAKPGEGLFAVPVRPLERAGGPGARSSGTFGRDVIALAAHGLNVAWGVRSPATYVGLPGLRSGIFEAEVMRALGDSLGPGGIAGPSPGWAAALGAVGARFVTSYVPIRCDGLVLVSSEPVPGTRAPLLVYRNERALPRWTLVRSARSVPGIREALDTLLYDPAFDPARAVVVEGPVEAGAGGDAGGREGGSGSVRFVSESSRRLEFRVESGAGGWLFVADAPLAGWRVEIDGQGAPLRAANVLGRAVLVPGGAHSVVMAYEPPGQIAGFAGTAIGLAALVALFVAARIGGRGR